MTGKSEGTFTPQGGQAIKAEAKVIADGNNKYRVVILYPAASAKTTRIELSGRGDDDEISIANKDWSKTRWTSRGAARSPRRPSISRPKGAKGGKPR